MMAVDVVEGGDLLTGLPEQTQPNPDPGEDLPYGLESDLGRFVSTLAQAVDRGISRQMAQHSLLPMAVHLLVVCRDKGECTATELAALLPVESARISQLVNSLVERGLIIRRRAPNDRRVVMLRLSEEGEELTSEVSQRMGDLYTGVTQGITERELQAFTATAFRMIGNLKAMSD